MLFGKLFSCLAGDNPRRRLCIKVMLAVQLGNRQLDDIHIMDAKAAAQGTAYSKSEVYKQLLLLQQTAE